MSKPTQIHKCVNGPTLANPTNSAGGKTLLGIHKHQGAFPDTFPTNSFMTRVFPVPQAISIFLAPFAHASKQSCWHFLNGGSEGVASSWMPVLEAALLATSLPQTAGGYHMLLLLAISTVRALSCQETIYEKMSKVESLTITDLSFLTSPRLFIVVRVTPLNWAYDLCSQDLDLLSTSRKLLVTKVQFSAWHHNGKHTKKAS